MTHPELLQYMTLAKQYALLAKLHAPLVLGGVAVGTLGLVAASRLLGGSGGAATPEAHWASRRELRQAHLLAKHGIVLGHIGNQIIRYDGPGHVFVDAATQSGKSRSLVTTTLLEPQPRKGPKVSVIVHDPKGDLYATTGAYRSTISRVIHLAPCSPQTDHYNLLDAIRVGTVHEVADLQMVGSFLVNPDGQDVDDESARHYLEMTAMVVQGLLLYGLVTQDYTSLGEFYVLTTQGGLRDAFATMATMPQMAIRQAAELVGVMDDKQFSGVATTLMRAFALYADPLIGDMVSYSDFGLQDLREAAQPVTIYLSVPFVHLERTRPLIRLLLRQWLGYATDVPQGWRTKGGHTNKGWHKLLVMGEEFPSLKRLRIAADLFNHGAGLGVQLCVITPSMNAIEEIWGTHHNFLDNSHIQAYFGITNPDAAEEISKSIGTHTVQKVRRTKQGGRVTVSTEAVKERLWDTTAVQNMDPNDVILVARNQRVIVQQTPWDQYEPWASRGVAV